MQVLATTLAALLGLIQCAQSHSETEDAGPPPIDAGAVDAGSVDAGTVDASTVDECAPPEDGFGTSEGSRFLPFTLDTCAGEPFEFYGEAEGFCDSSFTVMSMCAGWCGPCRQEAQLMREHIIDRYGEHGVRVVSTIFQDDEYTAPSYGFCENWQSEYRLTNVLVDPMQLTQIYFPRGALPANLIVDREGVIVHREYGVSTDLETLRSALDRLLGL